MTKLYKSQKKVSLDFTYARQHVYMYAYAYVSACLYMFVCMPVYVCFCVSVFCACLYIYLYVLLNVCLYACMHVYILCVIMWMYVCLCYSVYTIKSVPLKLWHTINTSYYCLKSVFDIFENYLFTDFLSLFYYSLLLCK